ncbi:MAG: YjbH domain-containing protein [Amaricoccus sp.]|uniref:YjbH domain-containing protein n=1 Tax=Amaricoccus sp. TaxID=1872485 RepID=UPI0039E59767
MSERRLRAGAAVLALAAAAAIAPGASAPAQDVPSRDAEGREVAAHRPSMNLYGSTGIIDLPSAEMQPDGQVTASYSQFGGFVRRNFDFQALPRLEMSLRYSTIHDWGRPQNPDYDLFDRSLDMRLQLLREGDYLPSLTIGFRDLLGTGVYSSEYVAATKNFFDNSLKVTGGVGWGRLASVGGIENPFCTISSSFCTREIEYGKGGKPTFKSMFHGEDMGFFGGVEWQTPIDKLTLKAEVSSDAYTREQESPDATFDRRSPFNFGAEYRVMNGITLGGYWMYGDAIGFNIVVSGNPYEPITPQDLGSGPMPVNPRPANANMSTAWVKDPAARDKLTSALSDALRADGITIDSMKFEGDAVDVYIINRRMNRTPKAIGRTARVLAVGMPYSVETFRITPVENGVPTTTVTVNRRDLEGQVARPDAGMLSWNTVQMDSAVPALTGQVWHRDVYPIYDWALFPVPTIQLFGGNDGFKPQLTAQLRGSVRVTPGLSFSTLVRQPVLGVFDDPGSSSSSGLPPVQSDSQRYYAGWSPKLVRLTGDYLFKLNPDTYGRVSAGLLERQFGGISGEVLWKPVNQNWGLGAELNYVKQRDFDSPFGFGHYDYDVVMGGASLYWNTGFEGIETQLYAGRYLAGDWGATLSVARRFANGWSVGAFVTKTDVTEDEFGEGSFDKGLTISIPLRWSTPFETRQSIDGDLRSLASNGGATLDIENRLYPIVRDMDRDHLEQNWGSFWQ